jgi:gamma-glutamyltranspeptidase/glutathione hydrolase
MPYVLKTLLGVLDWGLDAQSAAALLNFGAFNSPQTFIEGDHPAMHAQPSHMQTQSLLEALRARGHQINLGPQTSGVGLIMRDGEHWVGGADPRREGLVLGGP